MENIKVVEQTMQGKVVSAKEEVNRKGCPFVMGNAQVC